MHSFKKFLEEENTKNHINDLVNYACQHLGISQPPHIEVIDDKEYSKNNKSFGGYSPHNSSIKVNAAGRHIADVLRTLAHELVHHKQNEDGRLTQNAGETGSDFENEANSTAGIIMRNFGRANPGIYEETQVGHPPGHLHVFDVDDTLFHTTAKVGVIKNGKKVKSLSNREYNTYKFAKDETPDFSEFRSSQKFSTESKPVVKMIQRFRELHNSIKDKPNHRMIINTARADFDDKHEFLHTFRKHGIDIDHTHVFRAGNDTGPEPVGVKKAKIIADQLRTGNHNEVSLYDDSIENLHHFLSLRKKFPKVKFHAHHVLSDGSTNKLEI